MNRWVREWIYTVVVQALEVHAALLSTVFWAQTAEKWHFYCTTATNCAPHYKKLSSMAKKEENLTRYFCVYNQYAPSSALADYPARERHPC